MLSLLHINLNFQSSGLSPLPVRHHRCLCNILPEQLGVWCYPWPAPFENVDCTAYLLLGGISPRYG